ncbi:MULTISPECIES: helix-turn-helix domain-containing protein [Bacillaceae]|uniref:helix-turn-helix domain-containing protein n=1 Tax=Bacillaceae TaxID=186817 RepID=UPI00203EFDFE|nr:MULTISPECIES: helix-turn-helix domain-containing protein [Bacillaceae]MCM3055130.1 helix-turn-helix domain-containing protein [Caldibacillus thermoamylovorans]MED3644640.1 helix-turn-helix domain-containing protein [Caldifermentibacillus hisashii]
MIGLEYILELYGMQQIELAEKLGIKKQNINLWIKKTKDLQKTFTYVGTNFWHRR